MRCCASVITTPWLRLFSAELTNAFRRNCERLTLRSAATIHNAIAPTNEETTTKPISTSQTILGSAEPI
jgi:hypothetical protein